MFNLFKKRTVKTEHKSENPILKFYIEDYISHVEVINSGIKNLIYKEKQPRYEGYYDLKWLILSKIEEGLVNRKMPRFIARDLFKKLPDFQNREEDQSCEIIFYYDENGVEDVAINPLNRGPKDVQTN